MERVLNVGESEKRQGSGSRSQPSLTVRAPLNFALREAGVERRITLGSRLPSRPKRDPFAPAKRAALMAAPLFETESRRSLDLSRR